MNARMATVFQGEFSVVPRKVQLGVTIADSQLDHVLTSIDIFSYIISFWIGNSCPRLFAILGYVCKLFYQHLSALDSSKFCNKVDQDTVKLINGLHSTRRMIRLRYDCQNMHDYGFDGEFYIKSQSDLVHLAHSENILTSTQEDETEAMGNLIMTCQAVGHVRLGVPRGTELGSLRAYGIYVGPIEQYMSGFMQGTGVQHLMRDVCAKKWSSDSNMWDIHRGTVDWYIEFNYDKIAPINMGILDINCPPRTQPSLYCGYKFDTATQSVKIDQNIWRSTNKCWCYCEWIVYLINNIFYPKGYVVNGLISFCGIIPLDIGQMKIKNNELTIIRQFSMSQVLSFKQMMKTHGWQFLIDHLRGENVLSKIY